MNEMEVLLEQLDELLHEPILSGEDALEVAIVAGLASRLGASEVALQDGLAWRDGEGRELLDEGFEQLDLDGLVAEIDNLAGDEAEVVDEALSDFDDVVAASLWCSRRSWVKPAAIRVSKSIRQLPETFAELSALGSSMSGLATVARDQDIYDYWFAVAESAQWADVTTRS